MGHEENNDATDMEKDENRVGPESSETKGRYQPRHCQNIVIPSQAMKR